jgi:hypothetical protein
MSAFPRPILAVQFAAGTGEIRNNPEPNGVAGDRYDGDSRRRRFEAKGHRRSGAGNHIGICVDHFACNLLKTSRLILPPINDEIFTFDVAEALQFFKEGCCVGIAPDPLIFDFE